MITKDKTERMPKDNYDKIRIVVADSGKQRSLANGLAQIAAKKHTQKTQVKAIFEEMNNLANKGWGAIKDGDIKSIGQYMSRNHSLLQSLGVSSAQLDKLVNAAIAAGAYGAKLSGGGRGGVVISIVSPKTEQAVIDALLQAGAVSAYPVSVDTNGVQKESHER
jgi:mevalonate kinase